MADKPLDKPIATPGMRKAFKVYVRNPESGNVLTVRFGDPTMPDKSHIAARREAFRARHNCDDAKDKTTPRYWSCKNW